MAAVELVASSDGEQRRERLWRNIQTLGDGISLNAASPIVPWIVGEEKRALDLSQELQTDGFLVPAIRYPTVAKGRARLRISLTAAHQLEEIDALGGAIKKLSRLRSP